MGGHGVGDVASDLVGLGRTFAEALAGGDQRDLVRLSAEFAHRFGRADTPSRRAMIAAEPPPTGDDGWDAFLGALAEWLAVGAGLEAPTWTHAPNRYLRRGWWVTTLPSMRAWEYAGSPASFQIRGIYLHRDSLTNV